MKKTLTLVASFLMLNACAYHETNLQAAQAERDAALYQKRAQEGCTFVKDQEAYRECLLNTYYSKHPTTYQTTELTNGQPIAIVNSMTTYEKNSVPQVAPLPVAEAQILSYTTSETTTIDEKKTVEKVNALPVPTQTEVVEVEEVVAEVPAVVLPPEIPTPVLPKETAPAVQEPISPEAKPQPTWWDVHQEQGLAVPSKQKCPCDDPNDPCPQCFEK